MNANAEWLALRKTGIGGSDAPVVCGMSPWKSALELYLEKRGEAEPEDLSDNDAVRFGTLLEDVIADEYVRRTGRKVRRVNRQLRAKDHPFMVANLDRDVVGQPRILECKTAGIHAKDEWGEQGTDEVPEYYLLQCTHYLAATVNVVLYDRMAKQIAKGKS